MQSVRAIVNPSHDQCFVLLYFESMSILTSQQKDVKWCNITVTNAKKNVSPKWARLSTERQSRFRLRPTSNRIVQTVHNPACKLLLEPQTLHFAHQLSRRLNKNMKQQTCSSKKVSSKGQKKRRSQGVSQQVRNKNDQVPCTFPQVQRKKKKKKMNRQATFHSEE